MNTTNRKSTLLLLAATGICLPIFSPTYAAPSPSVAPVPVPLQSYWTRHLNNNATEISQYNTIWFSTLDPSGNLIVTAPVNIESGAPPDFKAFTVKYDGATGATLWSRTYTTYPESAQNNMAQAVCADSKGDVIITAERVVNLTHATRIVKYDAVTGKALWDSPIAGNSASYAGTAVDGNDDIYSAVRTVFGQTSTSASASFRAEAVQKCGCPTLSMISYL